MSVRGIDADVVTASTAESYLLLLYVISGSSASRRAVGNLRAICDERLPDRYTLEVIDLGEQPALAGEFNILAIPTLIKQLPQPPGRLIGDLSDTEKVLALLGLEAL